jgi:hypothetical protein
MVDAGFRGVTMGRRGKPDAMVFQSRVAFRRLTIVAESWHFVRMNV